MEGLVGTANEVIQNIFTLDSYRSAEDWKRNFYERTIARGRVFVVLKTDDDYLFAPSKFAGYKNNNINHANNRKSRDGRETNRHFDRFFKTRCKEDQKLDKAFLDYCLKYNISPAHYHNPRRYWLILEQHTNSFENLQRQLADQVAEALKDSSTARKKRIASAPKKPEKTQVSITVFKRSSDVIAEVLIRAKGHCERCLKPAPFIRKSDNTPYLEVHHIIQLSNEGDDTVENAQALCPNCHRHLHLGI